MQLISPTLSSASRLEVTHFLWHTADILHCDDKTRRVLDHENAALSLVEEIRHHLHFNLRVFQLSILQGRCSATKPGHNGSGFKLYKPAFGRRSLRSPRPVVRSHSFD